MSSSKFYILSVVLCLIVCGCEEEFIPEINNEPPEIVVEGYIEAGDNTTTPFVILTRSIPFFNEINLNETDGFFVRDADITVTSEDHSVALQEFCINELEPEQQQLAADLFGLNLDSTNIDFCVYIDPTFSMMGEIGKTYDLKVEVDGKTITGSTTLPEKPVLTNLEFFDTPGEPSDTLRELRVTLRDEPGTEDFYRYFTEVNEEGLLAPLNSTLNDLFFDGQELEFPLPKAEPSGVEFDLESFGFYRVGDTIDIKFCSIDEGHYDFWSTLEFNRANQGPFSTTTSISFNVEGGIGVWGGYTSSITRMIVE